jgi:hypothetical protein
MEFRFEKGRIILKMDDKLSRLKAMPSKEHTSIGLFVSRKQRIFIYKH